MAGPGDNTRGLSKNEAFKGYARRAATGSLLGLLAGCTLISIREGTDSEFFYKLDTPGNKGQITQLGRSASFFVREMTERGASCHEGISNGMPSRVVCVYAICRNGDSDIYAWRMEYQSRKVSRLSDKSAWELSSACSEGMLLDVQKAAARKYIESFGEEVL